MRGGWGAGVGVMAGGRREETDPGRTGAAEALFVWHMNHTWQPLLLNYAK